MVGWAVGTAVGIGDAEYWSNRSSEDSVEKVPRLDITEESPPALE